MQSATRPRLRLLSSVLAVTIAGAIAASCSSTGGSGKQSMTRKTQSKEYFSEAKYGKASPRVTTKRSRLPRGGGREQVGKPYKVAGKWYYPKEDKNYRKVGAASWYGDAFHGRLTANGEIYDMTHLTAAHPTMPLPSYARVTNLTNGSSVIVRVNDRGPFAHGRIIDLSKRAAEMLDYTHAGVAKVKVEYVGRAALDGKDDNYLMASYRPGKGGAPDPSDGLPTGVMVAMNGPSPSAPVQTASAFPGVLSDAGSATARPAGHEAAVPELPALGPVFPDRPGGADWPEQNRQVAMGLMSYADQRVKQAASPFDALGVDGLPPQAVIASWDRLSGAGEAAETAYVLAGTFASKAEAQKVAATLDGAGLIDIERSRDERGTWYSVEIREDERHSLDDILQAAWDAGVTDALAVRD